MKIRKISFPYREYESIEELEPDDKALVFAAGEAAGKAYAPYSRFKVGAAVRLESGKIITGANVENAAFPSGICAERNALAHSISSYPDDRAVTIAIAALNENGITTGHISPCGNCRQVIAEEESRNGNKIKVILAGKEKIIIIDSISSLLPLQFNRGNLNLILP